MDGSRDTPPAINRSKRRDPRFWMDMRARGLVQDYRVLFGKYDTREGIEALIKTLEGLNTLISARYEAGYKRSECLQEWVIFGRYHLDTCGNVLVIQDPPNAKIAPPSTDNDNVLTRAEFFSGPYKRFWGDEFCSMVLMNFTGNTIPPADARCPVCNNGWTIENVHDCEGTHRKPVEPLNAFVGRTLADVRRFYRLRTEAKYLVSHGGSIRNDKLIGTAVANHLGWMSGEVPDDYVIREGDETIVHVFSFEHAMCRSERIARSVEDEFRKAFEIAGYDMSSLVFTRIPNLRSPESEYYNGPGFRVESPFGKIVIGWRKRVIEIQWPEQRDLTSHFLDVRSTKGPDHVHAWSLKETIDYLSRIHRAFMAVA